MYVPTERPSRKIAYTRDANDSNLVEVWLVEPRFVGYLRKEGQKRIFTDDRQEFSNITAGVRYYLKRDGDSLADSVDLSAPPAPPQPPKRTAITRVTARQLIVRGAWEPFLEKRRYKRSRPNLDEIFELTSDELTALHLSDPED